jgi:hypothetical protein
MAQTKYSQLNGEDQSKEKLYQSKIEQISFISPLLAGTTRAQDTWSICHIRLINTYYIQILETALIGVFRYLVGTSYGCWFPSVVHHSAVKIPWMHQIKMCLNLWCYVLTVGSLNLLSFQLTGDIHEEVENHNRMLDRMVLASRNMTILLFSSSMTPWYILCYLG